MKYLTIILSIYIIPCFSQLDTLNQLDSNEKKTGWWITYLDEDLEILKDSTDASFCMYNYFTGRYFHYKFGKSLGSKKYPVHFPDTDTLQIGKYTLLNGEYVTKYKDGTVRSVLSAKNGVLIECKKYYPNGQLEYHLIYSEECGVPIRFCIREYNEAGEMVYDGYQAIPK